MPEIVGRFRPPRLPGAPASPASGEMYYDTGTNKLYWWNGTTWIDSTGGGGGGGVAEVFTGPGTPPGSQVLWIDTDEVSAGGPGLPAGGASGTVLNKKSATDYDVQWSAPSAGATKPPVVTTLPATPNDGDEVYYQLQDGGGNIFWHLRYNAAGPIRRHWEFLGGTPLTSFVVATETLASSGSPQDVATRGPEVSMPFKGDYTFSFSVIVSGMPSLACSFGVQTQVSVGPPDQVTQGVGVQAQLAASSTQSVALATVSGYIIGNRSNPQTMRLMYKLGAAVTGLSVGYRVLTITPLRVDP